MGRNSWPQEIAVATFCRIYNFQPGDTVSPAALTKSGGKTNAHPTSAAVNHFASFIKELREQKRDYAKAKGLDMNALLKRRSETREVGREKQLKRKRFRE